jgi:hypothetical protein
MVINTGRNPIAPVRQDQLLFAPPCPRRTSITLHLVQYGTIVVWYGITTIPTQHPMTVGHVRTQALMARQLATNNRPENNFFFRFLVGTPAGGREASAS